MYNAPDHIIDHDTTFHFFREHFSFGDFPAYRSSFGTFRFLLDGEMVSPMQLADYLDVQYVQQSESGIRQAVSHYKELRSLLA